ncbi:MAG: TMEM165/GDT1 family protein [Bacillota bacterium]
MLQEMIKAFLFIFMAEMGDKTQILAMSFATRYKTSKVLLGVFLGSALNHGIAIVLGVYLGSFIHMDLIQIIAGCLFVGFGLWTLKMDEEEEDEESKLKTFGPVLTVMMAFFIGELGDKTQLTAVTLATSSKYPVFIFAGTVTGMVVTSGIGIFLGSKVGEKIPEFTIKIASAMIFIFFGTLKLYQVLPAGYMNTVTISIYFLSLFSISYFLLKPSIEAAKSKRMTPLKEVALTLYINTHRMQRSIQAICLGKEQCKKCEGNQCYIGSMKKALEQVEEKQEYILEKNIFSKSAQQEKNYDQDKIMEGIAAALSACLNCGKEHDKKCIANQTREGLEILYFGTPLSFQGDIDDYLRKSEKIDPKFTQYVKKRIQEIKDNN